MTIGPRDSRYLRLLAVTCLLAFSPAVGVAAKAGRCTATAKTLFKACGFETQDDFWVAQARCMNFAEDEERNECNAEAGADRREAERTCLAQLDTRLGACDVLGEERYDPDFDAELFDADFNHLTRPNPYFPLHPGNKWTYRSDVDDEENTIELLADTKLIDEVPCIVSRDLVFRQGELHEGTDDWFAQAKDGNVWYCGEEVKNYETFEGDAPELPELVSIDGSFKAGRDRDKPGIIFLADPEVGDAYLEEFSLGNAEDVTEILSTNYSFGHNAELDELVPQALAQALCHNDCIVTKNYSLLEPGIFARKYFASGIGTFLEVEPDVHKAVRLISCNFDARCNTLPQP